MTKKTPRNQYRWRAVVQQPDTAAENRNDYDENDLTMDAGWTTYCSRRAAIRNANGRERFQDDQTIATRNVIVEMAGDRITRQITARHRVRYLDRDGVQHTLNIIERRVSPDGMTVELHCLENAS